MNEINDYKGYASQQPLSNCAYINEESSNILLMSRKYYYERDSMEQIGGMIEPKVCYRGRLLLDEWRYNDGRRSMGWILDTWGRGLNFSGLLNYLDTRSVFPTISVSINRPLTFQDYLRDHEYYDDEIDLDYISKAEEPMRNKTLTTTNPISFWVDDNYFEYPINLQMDFNDGLELHIRKRKMRYLKRGDPI